VETTTNDRTGELSLRWTPGVLILDGPIDRSVGPEALQIAADALGSADGVLVADCGGITKVDDRGVAFLMGVAGFASDRGVRIRLVDVPRSLRARLRRAQIETLFDWERP
jgi:ABC-type transporter Mla MlaB component